MILNENSHLKES